MTCIALMTSVATRSAAMAAAVVLTWGALIASPAAAETTAAFAAETQAGQGQTVSIDYKVPEGFRYGFQNSYRLDSTLLVSDGMRSSNVRQQIFTRVSGSAQVVRVEGGRPAELIVSFAPQSGTQIVTNGATQTQPFALAGQQAVVTVRNEKIVGIAGSGGGPLPADDATRNLIRPAVVFENAMRPGRPVSVGSQWDARLPQPDGAGETRLSLAVTRLGMMGDRPAALIQGQGSFRQTADGFSMAGPVQVSVGVDTGTGLPLDSTAMATVQINNTMVQGGQQFTLSGSGRIDTRQTLTPEGGAGPQAGPPFGSQAGPGAPPPAAPVPPAPQRPQASGDPRLVGVFRGEAIAGGGNLPYINTQLWWVFRSDGIVYYGAQSHFTQTKRNYNQETEWTVHGRSAGDVDRGRWRTQGVILSIQWDDGRAMRVAYSFEPDGALVFRNPNTRKLINFFPRVH